MRVVVSGTHASGKSTLISDFATRHPEFTVLPDPFELLDESSDSPSVAMFAAQLRRAADRLTEEHNGAAFIAERGPLDFLAYLHAMETLSGAALDEDALERATALTVHAMRAVDVLIVLPLSARDPIPVGEKENPELREAMDAALLDLIDSPDVLDASITVAEAHRRPGDAALGAGGSPGRGPASPLTTTPDEEDRRTGHDDHSTDSTSED